jgi:hypothetical protein
VGLPNGRAGSRPKKARTHPKTPYCRLRYEALRKIAFEERAKIHDLVMEGIDTVLRRRGYPSVESLKAGKKA